eukprot:13783262-Heterocapsa_arctica.AAC.1
MQASRAFVVASPESSVITSILDRGEYSHAPVTLISKHRLSPRVAHGMQHATMTIKGPLRNKLTIACAATSMIQ